jgi:hypothetical protein
MLLHRILIFVGALKGNSINRFRRDRVDFVNDLLQIVFVFIVQLLGRNFVVGGTIHYCCNSFCGGVCSVTCGLGIVHRIDLVHCLGSK